MILDKIALLENDLLKHIDLQQAIAMSAYMKNKFPFLGIKSPKRKEIQRQWCTSVSLEYSKSEQWEIIRELWNKEEREYQYIAMDIISSWKKNDYTKDDLRNFEFILINKTWWDTLDLISTRYVGTFAQIFTVEFEEKYHEWISSENFWLNRVCLIYQLKYKNKTDFNKLSLAIGILKYKKEFFIQKAIGWSLREISKWNPEWVKSEIIKHQLIGLAKREASKYLPD